MGSSAPRDSRPERAIGKPRSALDLGRIRDRLAARGGQGHWRSLEELADSEDFRSFLEAEFPAQASSLAGAVDRRHFLKLMGASLALAGASGCTRQPDEKIYPYVKAPEQIVPGEPLFYATAMPLAGFGTGLLVESHMGRPTKVEGNPEHPASLGATHPYAQASVLSLYDPDRAKVVTYAGEIRPWSAFVTALQERVDSPAKRRSLRLRILTETVTSPTLARQLRGLLGTFRQAKWHQWDPAGNDAARIGARRAFGRAVGTRYLFDRADVVLALDADFLGGGAGRLRYARDFMSRRRPGAASGAMNRLYVAEPMPTITGAVADHRLPLRADQIEELGLAVARGIKLPGRAPVGMEPHAKWIAALVRDLESRRGSCLVVAGDDQPPPVHVLAHALNHALANPEGTLVHTEPIEAEPVDQGESLRDLVAAMDAGEVDLLLILGGNPVFDAPADLRFAERLAKVPLRVHLSQYDDETSALCHWHVPEAHFLESWGDVRAFDGTATVIQPLIAPLYEGKAAHELLAALAGQGSAKSYDAVREHWKAVHPDADFERWWRKAVHDGVVPGSAASPIRISVLADWPQMVGLGKPAPESIEIVFRPDASVFDGRFANNGWLQELPRPTTRLAWDNAALIAPATAERLDVANGDVLELSRGELSVRGPAWIVPGHAADSVTVHLGYGRRRAGSVGDGAGFDAYALRTSEAPWLAAGLGIRKTGESHLLVTTQDHSSMEGRNLVRKATLEEYRAHPEFARDHEDGHHASLFPAHPYDGYAWGMTIDLGSCIGCNACVIACQAENNIPVVGKAEVAIGREMHWIRVDRYFEGDLDNPAIDHQPVPCMQCENAPCEQVCPVHATVHSDEGLNDMVYNRCVGTRYCSNNCPYKVRRFNFKLWGDWRSEPLKMLRNPDVSVRSRGVMEKCTYCVQRINYARIRAKREDRKIRDGEIVTACQAVCPAEAIVFGDLNDPLSRVSKLKADPRNYSLLGELGTKPRTTYLAAVRNPNPEIESPSLVRGGKRRDPLLDGEGAKKNHG
jgi:molybdopterin-containing oxidoreductase family iron-sulfur binding subunit